MYRGVPANFLLGLTLFGDVLLNIDPSAARERLVADQDDAAAFQVLGVRERFSACQLGNVLCDPLALLLNGCRVVTAGLHLDVVAHDFRERGARPRELLG